ncbi:MAG TPA: cyclic nucleotide-binding domain-containing protein, partial [Nocardioidaceae bacterium]|nr:cyclic nucleotide-binding domain-containing protein [Nocardioidaceae bacterium]
GEVLVRQGDRADNVYVVLSGSATVQLDGTEVSPAVGTGDCVGELAVLDDAPRAATVTASAPMTMLSFPVASFGDALAELPALREQVTRALTRRLRQVSTGWAQLAVDTDVLLDAFYSLQGSADEGDRHTAIKEAAALLRRLAEASPVPAIGTRLDALSPAERRVADLVAGGLSNAAVAAELFLSEHTVASHLKHIYVKLGLPSRVALAGVVLRSA